MSQKMTRWGVGPKFVVLSVSYGLLTIVLTLYFNPFFNFAIAGRWIFSALGIFLVLIGFLMFIMSIITVMRAYNADKLVTDGVYRLCRHPLYASWMVFIVPGVALLMRSWIELTASLFMYVILRILVRDEDEYLEKTFGDEYIEYRKRVPSLLPFGWLKSGVSGRRD